MGKQQIRVEENGLKVIFEIRNGITELKQFSVFGQPDADKDERPEATGYLDETSYPITEIQLTGLGTRGMHGYKHNVCGASVDFKYVKHTLEENEKGRKLVIYSETELTQIEKYAVEEFFLHDLSQTVARLFHRSFSIFDTLSHKCPTLCDLASSIGFCLNAFLVCLLCVVHLCLSVVAVVLHCCRFYGLFLCAAKIHIIILTASEFRFMIGSQQGGTIRHPIKELHLRVKGWCQG